MARFIMVVIAIQFFTEARAQRLGTNEFIFEWTPNPTQFLRENHKVLLSKEEYRQLLNCDALVFETHVDLFNSKIISIKYSILSTEYNKVSKISDLDSQLAEKMEKILFKHIGLTKIKQINGDDIPKEIRIYFMSIDFNKKDKRSQKP